jgi:hypothetical protein
MLLKASAIGCWLGLAKPHCGPWGLLDPTRLVFIDETRAKANMTRTHGRSLRGTRLVAHVPQARGSP